MYIITLQIPASGVQQSFTKMVSCVYARRCAFKEAEIVVPRLVLGGLLIGDTRVGSGEVDKFMEEDVLCP